MKKKGYIVILFTKKNEKEAFVFFNKKDLNGFLKDLEELSIMYVHTTEKVDLTWA